MRIWFLIHITTGLLIPIVVLFHTGFAIGSINGAMAVISMAIVVFSGIFGKFVLRRIDRSATWKKVFDWWHIIHIPVVYFMLITIILHAISVHMY
jgi:hypothetical protein